MEKAFKCNLCSDKLNTLHKLNAHIKSKHKRSDESKKSKLACNLCGRECGKERALIIHMRTHTGERPFKCPDSDCGMAFKQEAHLKRHIMLKYSNERPLKCDFSGCLYTGKTASHLKAHKKFHSDKRPLLCPQSGCNLRAKNKEDVPRHQANFHNQSTTFSCSKCMFKANTAQKLASHMNVHDGRNEKIPCSIEGCEYKGKNSRALKRHLWRHNTVLPCPVPGCGQYLRSKEASKNHMKLHNPFGGAFQCPLCFEHFPTRFRLRQHCVVHTNEKPFQCGHCKHEAATRAQIKAHISAVHVGIEFPFIVQLLDDRECLRCKITFPSAAFLDHCKGHVNPAVII